jgi:putative transposase
MAGLVGVETEPDLGLGLHRFTRARRAAIAILDVVSRKWIATLVCAEETSTQVEVCFTAALRAEGLLELGDALATEALRAALTDAKPDALADLVAAGQVPLLLAISDNGPQMRSYSTREFLAAVAIAQQFGRPHTPQDQAWLRHEAHRRIPGAAGVNSKGGSWV